MAIENLKRYKLLGIDQIPAEMIQAGNWRLHSELHELINSVCNKDKLHQQLKELIIVPFLTDKIPICFYLFLHSIVLLSVFILCVCQFLKFGLFQPKKSYIAYFCLMLNS